MERKYFYEVTMVQDGFKVSRGGGQIAILECDALEQYGKALLARKGELSTLYLPAKFGDTINYNKGLVKVTENVEAVIYHEKKEKDDEFLPDEGVLLLKIRTDDVRYWTLINMTMFNFDLTDEVVFVRWQNQVTIPCASQSEFAIIEEFDYLPAEYMIQVDNEYFLADVSYENPIIKSLGNVQVIPLPEFSVYFKMVSSQGLESFESFNRDISWGQFNRIEKYTINLAPYTTFYVGKDQYDRVCGMFYDRYINEDDATDENDFGMITFDEPVIVTILQDVINTDEGEFAVWKFLYEDNRINKLFICSITNANQLQILIDVSKYF